MAPWLRVLEAYMVQALLRTPAFHRAVEKVAKNVHRIRHGPHPEDMGGTKLDQPTNGSFLRHFGEEVQTQLGRAEGKSGGNDVAGARGAGREATQVEEEGADAAWRNAQRSGVEGEKHGFIGQYVGALREQIRGGK